MVLWGCRMRGRCLAGQAWARLRSQLDCSHPSSSKIGASPRAACAVTAFSSVLPFSHPAHAKFLAGIAIFRVSWDAFLFIVSVLRKLFSLIFKHPTESLGEYAYTHIPLFLFYCFCLTSRNTVPPFQGSSHFCISNKFFLVTWNHMESSKSPCFPSIPFKPPAKRLTLVINYRATMWRRVKLTCFIYFLIEFFSLFCF